jgi:hypothetical protein
LPPVENALALIAVIIDQFPFPGQWGVTGQLVLKTRFLVKSMNPIVFCCSPFIPSFILWPNNVYVDPYKNPSSHFCPGKNLKKIPTIRSKTLYWWLVPTLPIYTELYADPHIPPQRRPNKTDR